MRKVVIRSGPAGVFFGELKSKKLTDAGLAEVKLRNSRRVWYWDGASSVSELATKGVARPENCKFAPVVEKMTVLGVCEIIDMTEEAWNNMSDVPVWTQF